MEYSASSSEDVVPIRLDPELRDAIATRANSDGTGTSEVIRRALESFLHEPTSPLGAKLVTLEMVEVQRRPLWIPCPTSRADLKRPISPQPGARVQGSDQVSREPPHLERNRQLEAIRRLPGRGGIPRWR